MLGCPRLPKRKTLLSRRRRCVHIAWRMGSRSMNGWKISGRRLTTNGKGFNQVIEQIELGAVKRLVIGYQDRLVRFGYDWFEAFCERHGTEILVLDGESFSP